MNLTRLLCLILAIVMIAGMGTLGLMLLIDSISAADYEGPNYTFSSETDGDTYIAVGLMYGSGVTVGFEIKSPYGFMVGPTTITENVRAFNGLYHIESNIASVTLDYNLSKKAMTYSLTDQPERTVIGAYHLEVAHNEYDFLSIEYLMDEIGRMLPADESVVYPIPSYINGKAKVRLGHYPTKEEANAALEAYSSYFEGYTVTVVEPSRTGVSVVNPETDVILFEYDSGESLDNLGFMAYQADEFTSYIQTPADNLYEGVMTFVPQYSDAANGVKLINLLDLESYVEGVLPYEISNSWSYEVLRTFAITIRSYAIANYCKWFKTYGFDMTATTNDQVYRGRNRVTDAVVSAVETTAGMITVYDGKIISAYYSSSMGGSTIGSQYVWGSARGYLTTVYTPWERYTEYNNGIWQSEVSPNELYKTLRSKGYTDLTGPIERIDVETVEDNPDYVYSLTFTDVNGNTAKLKRSDTVRTVLSSYLKSANFKVGQGSLERTYDKVYSIEVVGEGGVVRPPEQDNESYDISGYYTDEKHLIANAYVMTGDGGPYYSEYPIAYVLTSTGRKVMMNTNVVTGVEYDDTKPFEHNGDYITIIDKEDIIDSTPVEEISETDENTETYSSITYSSARAGDGARKVYSEFDNLTIITTLETVTETITASSSENFIFAGKGWGHGVGISQYGAKDLADAGAHAEDIISIYFTDVEIIHIDDFN